MDLAAHL